MRASRDAQRRFFRRGRRTHVVGRCTSLRKPRGCSYLSSETCAIRGCACESGWVVKFRLNLMRSAERERHEFAGLSIRLLQLNSANS